MPRRYFIKTFGCQMNEYDSARVADVLRAGADLVATDDPLEADLLLMNTCSVREKAQEKVFSLLGEWRLVKARRPQVIIGVGGCVASQEGAGITERAPFVDLVFGPQTLHRLPQMLDELRRTGKPVVDVSFPEIEKFDRLPAPRAEGARAFVSIMEGCSKYCSFCIVPYTRGEEVSRCFDSVLEEVGQLAAQGVAEVTLLGQNVNAYCGAMADGARVDLATLIHHVARVPGIERIRFTTSHPLEFNDSLIEAFASVGKLADHLHLPVQSGSDRGLAPMQRGSPPPALHEEGRKPPGGRAGNHRWGDLGGTRHAHRPLRRRDRHRGAPAQPARAPGGRARQCACAHRRRARRRGRRLNASGRLTARTAAAIRPRSIG